MRKCPESTASEMGSPWEALSPPLGSGKDKCVPAPLALEAFFQMSFGGKVVFENVDVIKMMPNRNE